MAIPLTAELARAHIGHMVIHKLRSGSGASHLPAKLVAVINDDTVEIIPPGHRRTERVKISDCKLTAKTFGHGEQVLDLDEVGASTDPIGDELRSVEHAEKAALFHQPKTEVVTSRQYADMHAWGMHRPNYLYIEYALENGLEFNLRYLLNAPPDWSYGIGVVQRIGSKAPRHVDLRTSNGLLVTRGLDSCAMFKADNQELIPQLLNIQKGLPPEWAEEVKTHAKKKPRTPLPDFPRPAPVAPVAPVQPAQPELATVWHVVRWKSRLIYDGPTRDWMPLTTASLERAAKWESEDGARITGSSRAPTGTQKQRLLQDEPEPVPYARARAMARWCDQRREAEAREAAEAAKLAQAAADKAVLDEYEAAAKKLEEQAEKVRAAGRAKLDALHAQTKDSTCPTV